MNRHDINILAAERGYPCLTITLPTHRTSPDNRQDAIRLKNLAGQAVERITGEVGRREADGLVRQLDQLVERVDHQYNLDGLALFVHAHMMHIQRLPFTLPERVIVDETFFLRDLVYAFNRSPRYWVLALSEQTTRLFEAVRDDLEENIAGSPFPMTYGERGGEGIAPREPALNTSQLRDDYRRAFFRNVGQAFAPYMAEDQLPLAIIGVDRAQSFFREVTSYDDAIVGTVLGNHDTTSTHELGKLVWPQVREGLAARRARIFDELGTAVGGQRSASTLGEVWRCAEEGRGATLVVEESYHEPATIDERGLLHPLPAGAALGPADLDDAVDEVIAVVLDKGGRVVFVDDGSLDAHSRIALILRY